MKTSNKYKQLTALKPEIINDKQILQYMFAKNKGFYRYSNKRNANNKPNKRIDIVGRFIFISNIPKEYVSVNKEYFIKHWDEYKEDCYAYIDYRRKRILIRCKDDGEYKKVKPVIDRANKTNYTIYTTPYEIKADDISSTGEVNKWIFLHIDYLAKQFIESVYGSIYRILNFNYNDSDINKKHILVLRSTHKDNPIMKNIRFLCQKYKLVCSLQYNKFDTNRKVTIRLNSHYYIQVLLPTIVNIINNNILNRECYDYIIRFENYHDNYNTRIKFEYYNDYVGKRGSNYFALNDDYIIFNTRVGLKQHIKRLYNISINKSEFTNITKNCASVEDSFKNIVDYLNNNS